MISGGMDPQLYRKEKKSMPPEIYLGAEDWYEDCQDCIEAGAEECLGHPHNEDLVSIGSPPDQESGE